MKYPTTTEKQLLHDIKQLIEKSKQAIISNVNAELVALNWNIGKLIKSEIIVNKRSEYGEQIVATVSQQLTLEVGRGYTVSALFRMIKFFETFPDFEIVATLSQHLGWSHFIELIPLNDPLKKDPLHLHPSFLIKLAAEIKVSHALMKLFEILNCVVKFLEAVGASIFDIVHVKRQKLIGNGSIRPHLHIMVDDTL